MSDYDLNGLVETGKEDVLQFVKQNLFSQMAQGGKAKPLYGQFFLSMKKQRAELDVLRTRSMIIQENEEFLSTIQSSDPDVVAVMAHAAGRVSQMGECLKAVGRMIQAHEGTDEAALEDMKQLYAFLRALEKRSVRMGRNEEGRFFLLPLSDIFGQDASFPEGGAEARIIH